jgi:hypothetical protein
VSVFDDSRVVPSSGTNDGSYDINKPDGWWIAFPEEGTWKAASYSGAGELGPFGSAEEAVKAVLAR